MKNSEAMPDQTARDLLSMVFDEGGVAVPADDLAPAAMAGYRRYRRRRTAVTGAGAAALVLAVAGVAVFATGGGSGPRIAPGPGSSAATSAAPHSSASVPGGGSRLMDCYSNFEVHGDKDAALKAQADCLRAEGLWRDVFPDATVSGARNPTLKQITDSFLARIEAQNASAPSLYSRPQPQVLQDWTEAKQEEADSGFQTWSAFNIKTAQGTITVSAVFLSDKSPNAQLPCGGSTPCGNEPLTDNSIVEVSGDPAHGYSVTARLRNDGVSYRISFSGWNDPTYVDIPCEAVGGHCYADLTDGSIRPGLVPDSEAVTSHPVVTDAVLIDILHRPAFAKLVQGYFTSQLGRTASP